MIQWILANWQSVLAVALAVLPTLIVGFTNYPKVDGVLTIILKILNAFSVASHSDSPGTFKLPLVQSKPPGA